MQILSNHISALNVCISPKFLRFNGNRGRGTRWWRHILDRKWKYGRFVHAQWNLQYNPYLWPNRRNFRDIKEIGAEEHDGTSDFSPEVEIRPVRACAMHPAIIIGRVRSLWTWLWGRYHVPQNAFLVCYVKSVSNYRRPAWMDHGSGFSRSFPRCICHICICVYWYM